MKLTKIMLLLLTTIISFSAFAAVRVHGYHRNDGTYVRPHYRSNPNGNKNDNWSHIGNINPYTGEAGTKK